MTKAREIKQDEVGLGLTRRSLLVFLSIEIFIKRSKMPAANV
jgi:hypothetical protein